MSNDGEWGIWVQTPQRQGWLRSANGTIVRGHYELAWTKARNKALATTGSVTYSAKRIPGWGRLAFRYVGLRMTGPK